MQQEEQTAMETATLRGSGGHAAPPEPDPEGLMERFLEKDPRAATELYRRYASRIYGMGKAMLGTESEARKLVEDTFVQLWRTAPRFDPARDSLEHWVFLTASRSLRQTPTSPPE